MYTLCVLGWLRDLGPLAVALAVFCVTWSFYRWQVRLAKQKLCLDLYDRRFAIYLAFQELLFALVERKDDEIKAAFRKASVARFEAPFLLADLGIQAYLEALCKEVSDKVISNIMFLDAMKEHPALKTDPHICEDTAKKSSQLGSAKLSIHDRHLRELSEQFTKFLKLTDFSK
jgi:hypothetical protein